MKLKSVLAAAVVAAFAMPAAAQLSVYEDYDISEEVWLVTTVKVDPNMGDYYLEGLKSTWVEANEVAKELGQNADYKILGSAFTESGDFNMMLMIKFDSMADLGPSREDYEAFMAAWGEANEDANRETAKTYPELRKIKGEYVFHEVTFNE